MVSLGNILYFIANDGINGEELWRSDGTATGTNMVKDINTSGSSFPSRLINVNGTLYFFARDNNDKSGLWKSNGTETGTVLVKDFSSSNQVPGLITHMNGTLYFKTISKGTVYTPVNQRTGALWKSDGTAAGTVKVKDKIPDR